MGTMQLRSLVVVTELFSHVFTVCENFSVSGSWIMFRPLGLKQGFQQGSAGGCRFGWSSHQHQEV